MSFVERQILLKGQVQGVGFRNFTLQQAKQFGVKGWVRNLVDGRVEAIVVCPLANWESFSQSLVKSPPVGKVENVEVVEISGLDFNDFTIAANGESPWQKH